MKRFDYDWESNRSLKFDDYFEFPRQLNVTPYTYDSINKGGLQTDNASQMEHEPIKELDELELSDELSSTSLSVSSQNKPTTSKSFKNKTYQSNKNTVYELVGVIVHSGQANAGHYYSFIKAPKNSRLVL